MARETSRAPDVRLRPALAGRVQTQEQPGIARCHTAERIEHRFPRNSVAIRFTFAAFFFSQGNGFTPMGIYDAAFGLLLLIAYLPAISTLLLPDIYK